MILPRRRRRRIDLAVAATIALAAAAAATVVYLGSDARATTLMSTAAAEVPATPTPLQQAPAALQQRWQLSTDPTIGAIATPYGTVITTDKHAVRGFDALDGSPLWSYTRSNSELCGIGSGDTQADPLSQWTGVHGVMTAYAKSGYCSQITLFDPQTGERLYQRTSPNQNPGAFFFGTPYVGWLGTSYLELWRHDLVATVRYGEQPNPVNAKGPHRGCTFSDAAVTADQFATIERCEGGTNLVLNWPTPNDAPTKGDKGWDANFTEPKATIPLHSSEAVILSTTGHRAAVLVAEPEPAIVVYDSDGTQLSRTPVTMNAADIGRTAAAGLTPAVTTPERRYTLVGDRLFSYSTQIVTVPAPPSDDSADEGDESDESDEGDETQADGDAPATVDVGNPVLDWSAPGVHGLPALVGTTVLLPTAAGLAVVDAVTGETQRTILVDRGDYQGRIDVTTVGSTIVEVRGGDVVGLVDAG